MVSRPHVRTFQLGTPVLRPTQASRAQGRGGGGCRSWVWAGRRARLGAPGPSVAKGRWERAPARTWASVHGPAGPTGGAPGVLAPQVEARRATSAAVEATGLTEGPTGEGSAKRAQEDP